MGRWEASLKYHDKALEIKPDFDYALYAKGESLDRLGRHEEGLELITQSLELNPNYDHAWMAKAEALHALGRLEECRDALNNALILNPGYEDAWIFRGKVLEEMGNSLEAERCYEEALHCMDAGLGLDPEDSALALRKARLLDDLVRTEEALEAYAAAAAHASDAAASMALVDALLRAGRVPDALAPAEEATTRFPQDPRGWHAAARVWLARGDPAQALRLLEKALSLGGGANVRLDRARALSALGRQEEALSALADGGEGDSVAQLLKADLLQSLGRTDAALEACDAALRADPAAGDVAYHRKGKLLLAAGRAKEATAALDAALGLNPRDPEVWCDAAVAWRTCGREATARRLLDRALELDPHLERALRLRDLSSPPQV